MLLPGRALVCWTVEHVSIKPIREFSVGLCATLTWTVYLTALQWQVLSEKVSWSAPFPIPPSPFTHSPAPRSLVHLPFEKNWHASDTDLAC